MTWSELGVWTRESLWDLVATSAAAHPTRTAVVGPRGAAGPVTRWTYAELVDRAERAAEGFHRAGVGPGDPVLVQLPNCVEFCQVVLALFRLGACPVFALPAHRGTELRHVAVGSGATVLVTADVVGSGRQRTDHRALARDLVANTGIELVVVVGDPAEFASFHELTAPAAPVDLPEPPVGSDRAFLQLSGGTTGVPKLIPRTHADYAYSVRESARICGLDEHGVGLVVLPVAHNFPMSSPGVLGLWFAGGTVVLAPDATPATCFPIVAAERVTTVSLVPPLALLWTAAAPDTPHDLSSLRVVGIGGAKCTPELARRIRPVLGAQLQQVFGMAEGLVNYTRLDDPDDVVEHTQGRPLSPYDEIRVVDDEDREVPAGERGHLLTRGPYTIRGYTHVDPDQVAAHNAGAFTADGFYRTGDLVRVRADGNLVVEGRAKDQVNRGGEKVSAEEVEDVLLTHPLVHDAALVGIPDEFLGERTCVFVVPTAAAAPGDLTTAVVRRHVRERGLAEFKIPDRVVVVPQFPPTAVGKTSRRQLRTVLADLVREA